MSSLKIYLFLVFIISLNLKEALSNCNGIEGNCSIYICGRHLQDLTVTINDNCPYSKAFAAKICRVSEWMTIPYGRHYNRDPQLVPCNSPACPSEPKLGTICSECDLYAETSKLEQKLSRQIKDRKALNLYFTLEGELEKDIEGYLRNKAKRLHSKCNPKNTSADNLAWVSPRTPAPSLPANPDAPPPEIEETSKARVPDNPLPFPKVEPQQIRPEEKTVFPAEDPVPQAEPAQEEVEDSTRIEEDTLSLFTPPPPKDLENDPQYKLAETIRKAFDCRKVEEEREKSLVKYGTLSTSGLEQVSKIISPPAELWNSITSQFEEIAKKNTDYQSIIENIKKGNIDGAKSTLNSLLFNASPSGAKLGILLGSLDCFSDIFREQLIHRIASSLHISIIGTPPIIAVSAEAKSKPWPCPTTSAHVDNLAKTSVEATVQVRQAEKRTSLWTDGPIEEEPFSQLKNSLADLSVSRWIPANPQDKIKIKSDAFELVKKEISEMYYKEKVQKLFFDEEDYEEGEAWEEYRPIRKEFEDELKRDISNLTEIMFTKQHLGKDSDFKDRWKRFEAELKRILKRITSG